MENLYTKEKKLETVLNRLENLSKSSTGYLGEINDLYEEKNQLEIEKNEAENKYNQLLLEHDNLKRKLKTLEEERVGKTILKYLELILNLQIYKQ